VDKADREGGRKGALVAEGKYLQKRWRRHDRSTPKSKEGKT